MDRHQELRIEILEWAKKHKFLINPSKGYEIYVKNSIDLGRCPCDARRIYCPCPESLTEVPEKGYCLCRLFWRNYDVFLGTLSRGKNEQKPV